MNRSMAVSQRRARGMTLVETLVAVVVLSIGLLGVATLQMTTLRYNHSAHMRSQATVLAYDISDRMRANRSALAAYAVALGVVPTGSTVADVDVTAWKTLLDNTLPAGDGSIAINGNRVTITVQWDDSRDQRGESAMSFTTETQL